jgi:hypothetical protein
VEKGEVQSSEGEEFVEEERMLKGYGDDMGLPDMRSCYVTAQDLVACCGGIEMEEFQVEDCEFKWKGFKPCRWT